MTLTNNTAAIQNSLAAEIGRFISHIWYHRTREISGKLSPIIFAAFLLMPNIAAAGTYADSIVAAAEHLGNGANEKAAQAISEAVIERPDDAFSHIVMGALHLHTQKPDLALREFNTARSLDAECALAAYGIGVCKLLESDIAGAGAEFDTAAKLGLQEAAAAGIYISALSGNYPKNPGTDADLLVIECAAQGLLSINSYSEARALFSLVTESSPPFKESLGAVVTFDAKKPIELKGSPLSKPFKSPIESSEGLKKFKGNVVLKADLAKAQEVAYVAFKVDGKLIGIVNRPPYECIWNSTNVSNAPHVITIEGFSKDGVRLSEKSTRVMIANPNPPPLPPLPEEDLRIITKSLFECIKLKPSIRAAWYGIAISAQAEGDSKTAVTALQRLVGTDPDYKDARRLLIQKLSSSSQTKPIWRINTTQKIAALTFDDGPKPETAKLLDILSSYQVHATFFVVGEMAQKYPEITRQIAENGHEVEMHTYSHKNLRYISDEDVEKELVRNAAIIGEITGRQPKYFRPPGGHQNGNLSRTVGKYGYTPIFWTVNCSSIEGTKKDKFISKALGEVKPGAIILMHNVEDVTLQSLPKIIESLRAKGYKLVTLSELIAAGTPVTSQQK